jgi:hypothetical protein
MGRMTNEKPLTCLIASCALLGLASLAGADESGTDFRPLRIDSYVDLGQIVKGHSQELRSDLGGRTGDGDIRDYFLSNIGIALVSEAVVKDKLDLKIGVGGLFWYPFPNLSAVSRIIKFGPGISEASFQYGFLDNLFFKFGFFPYKYNPDARNLGEYLFRSECYPSFVKTGGWSWLNSAAYQSLGAQLHWDLLGGAWSHDLLVFSEFEESPIWDFSPAYVTTFRAGGIFEVGAGVSLHRWLPIKPSSETPDAAAATYVEIDDFPALPEILDTVRINAGKPKTPDNIDAIVRTQKAYGGGTLKEMESHILAYKEDPEGDESFERLIDSVGQVYFRDKVSGQIMYPKVIKRLSFQGIKLMGRASLDFKPLLGLRERLGPRDLKLYGEIAVLGVQDQPYYYENVFNRMPMMLGLNLPAFKMLDELSVQVEYYRNPFPDSKEQSFGSSYPIWGLSPGGDNPAVYDQSSQAGVYREDDWKWSVNAVKTLTRGLQLQLQAANDHFRLRDDYTRPSVVPITSRKSDWYYLLRLQWGV